MTGRPEKSGKRPPQKPEKKIPKKITAPYLHNSGLHYLERFSASAAHFRRVMARKIDKSCRHHTDQNREDCLQLLDALIEKFIRAGLLDDSAYTSAQVTTLRRRGESARAIESRLSVKGLTRDVIRAALNTADENTGMDDFHAALRFARRRRIGPFKSGTKIIERDKEMATLARGGYSFEIADKILRLTPEEAADLIL